MNKNFFFTVISIAAISLIAALLIFASSLFEDKDSSSEFKIAASIFPLADIARNIAGDNAEVVQILPSGASPHTFDPSPSQQAALNGSEIMFMIGHDLDNWAEKLAKNTSNNIEIIVVDSGVELEESNHETEGDYEEEGHEEEGVNPHYWMSYTNTILIAENIKDALVKIDGKNSKVYESNFEKYKSQVQASFDNQKSLFEELDKREIITFHDAFGYFADDLGIEVAAVVEEFPGKEPTASYLSELGEIIEKTGIKTFFKEPQLSDSIISALASDYNASVENLDPIGGTSQETSTFLKTLEFNAQKIYNSLNE
jgi:zinc transport system substrate-binding protein